MSEFKFNKKLITSIIFFLMLTSGFIGFFNFSEILNFYNVEAMTIIVDCNNEENYDSIQKAIDDAKNGDIIYVNDGTYFENVIINKPITLIGNGIMNTTINGGGIGDVIKITVDWVNISGFTITNSGNLNIDHWGIDAGIDLNSVKFCAMENNIFINNNCGIFSIYSDKNKFENNLCKFNNDTGITLECSNSNLLKNNTCFENDFGISLSWDSYNNVILNNNCSNNSIGIWVRFFSDNNTISKNICISNDYGIHIQQAWSNYIRENICLFNNNGTSVFYGGFNLIENNVINNNNRGFTLFGCKGDSQRANRNNSRYNSETSDSHYFLYNDCSSNKYGIFIFSSDKNTIYFNNIQNNTYDFYLKGGDGLNPNYNKIQYNNIISNNICVINNGTNYWNNTIGDGNYWSDYKGTDTGNMKYTWDAIGKHMVRGDDIGDTFVPHLNLDYYPFINCLNWPKPGMPILDDPGYVDNNGNYSLNWFSTARTIGYILEEDNSLFFDSPTEIYNGSSKFFNILRKANGTYYYRVKGYSESFSSPWSNIVDIIVNWPPNIPKNLIVSSYPPGNTLNLSWEPNIIGVNEYILEFKNETMASWQQLEPIIHPGSTYNHTGLVDGMKYYYHIRAQDHHGKLSNFSEIISGIPIDIQPPAPPTGPTIISTTNDSISLVWKPNPEEDIEGYYIYRSESKIPEQWGEPIGKTSKNSEKYIDYNLKESTTYYYVITGFDEVPNESGYSKIIIGKTLIGPRAPEVNNSTNNLEMAENTYDNSINLSSWFKDQNNDSLYFWCEGNENISVNINQKNGTVILKPKKNWFGKETLTFYASDGIFEKSFNITIIVVQINDPPGPIIITEPADNLKIEYQTLINFSASCSDADLPYGDKLTFTWSSNISGEFGIGYNLSNIILPPGHHKITLTVTDSGNLSSFRSINITVLPMKDINGLRMDDNNSDTQVTISRNINSNNILFPSIIFLIIIVILVIIFVSNKKFHTLEKKELKSNRNDYSKIKQVKRKI